LVQGKQQLIYYYSIRTQRGRPPGFTTPPPDAPVRLAVMRAACLAMPPRPTPPSIVPLPPPRFRPLPAATSSHIHRTIMSASATFSHREPSPLRPASAALAPPVLRASRASSLPPQSSQVATTRIHFSTHTATSGLPSYKHHCFPKISASLDRPFLWRACTRNVAAAAQAAWWALGALLTCVFIVGTLPEPLFAHLGGSYLAILAQQRSEFCTGSAPPWSNSNSEP
jgi:hypothetical protein